MANRRTPTGGSAAPKTSAAKTPNGGRAKGGAAHALNRPVGGTATRVNAGAGDAGLRPATPDDDEQLAPLLRDLLVARWGVAGNKSLREELIAKARDRLRLSISTDDYWRVRNRLRDTGEIALGRGRGGSVHLVMRDEDEEAAARAAQPPIGALTPEQVEIERTRERDLYAPFHEVVRTAFVREYGYDRAVAQVTAHQGRRVTGGTWTRPDVSLVAVRAFTFLPVRVEVTTFEIKPVDGFDVDAVFEAAAHTARSHRAFACFQIEFADIERVRESDVFERIVGEAERFGVGVILFGNPRDWNEWRIEVDSRYHEADPDLVDEFIRIQFSGEAQDSIKQHLDEVYRGRAAIGDAREQRTE